MSTDNLFEDADFLFGEVCKIFKKTENEVDEDVETIKAWLQSQQHLPEIMRESHIRNLLITNKFSVERTKQKIDAYYTIRSSIPDFFDDCNPKSSQMRAIFENTNVALHPKLVQGLYRTYMLSMDEKDKFSPRETILTVCNAAEVRLYEDCVYYEMYMIDLANFTFNDLAKMTPSLIMKGLSIYQNVYSLRIKAVHLINAPPYISNIMTILKMVLKPKIFDRVHVHENGEILKEIFDVDDLPKDYGGNGPTLKEMTSTLRAKFDKYESRFDDLDNMRVDESLRPGNLVNDEILGFYGNFKKLSVD